ncbi:hypothetical protein AX774_g6714 [Zancudomyces culisetae]|uniref:Uncharacterized protein n=1 Tax=Zancudomyces culisetae TaxID=1213189 RepID=A0A1R1PFZ7_ZANCU|nr:hypothetical protein AX774_g6714 [Zancudomyces culisetae]|eukprot:OMH79849.1 hypothetical protein AX774_g6714 [Zancudomyces culisetae]
MFLLPELKAKQGDVKNITIWNLESVAELIDGLELFKKYPRTLYYSSTMYADDTNTSEFVYDHLIKEVCNNPSYPDGVSVNARVLHNQSASKDPSFKRDGCEYPYRKLTGWGAMQVGGDLPKLIEYKVCKKQCTCERTLSVIPYEKYRKFPVEAGCSFALFDPVYSSA